LLQNDTISCNRCTPLFKYTLHAQRKHTETPEFPKMLWLSLQIILIKGEANPVSWHDSTLKPWGRWRSLFSKRRKQVSKLDFVRHWQTEHQIHLKVQTEKLRKVISRGQVDIHTFTELRMQNYRITQVGRDLPGSLSPTPGSKMYHPNSNSVSESAVPTLPELQWLGAIHTTLWYRPFP